MKIKFAKLIDTIVARVIPFKFNALELADWEALMDEKSYEMSEN